MNSYKKWPRIVLIVLNIVALIGMFLPWLAASGYRQPKNAFDEYFDPTKWVLLVGIIVNAVLATLALITKKDELCKASGIVGIIMCVIMLGTIALVCLGQSLISFRASSYGIQENFGIGFFMSAVAVIVAFAFSIVSLKAKNK